MKKHSKKITLESLARMIERGFEEVATKKELGNLRSYVVDRFAAMDLRLGDIDNQIDQIKKILGPLARTVAQTEIEIRDLRARVMRLERRTGIAK